MEHGLTGAVRCAAPPPVRPAAPGRVSDPGDRAAAPGRGDELAALLLEAADALREAGGCLLYLVNRVDDDPEAVWVMELWTDEAAHRASLELASVREVIGRARPLIAGPGERFELRTIGGLGPPGL